METMEVLDEFVARKSVRVNNLLRSSFKLPIHRSGPALNGKIIPNSEFFFVDMGPPAISLFRNGFYKSVVSNFVNKRVKSREINACRQHYK